jgi:hypothetical protein
MRRKIERARRRRGGGLTILTVISIGGIACLLAGWNAHTPRKIDLSPADVVALRFPDADSDAWGEVADARAEASAADDAGATQYSMFSPYPTMAPPSAAPRAYETAGTVQTGGPAGTGTAAPSASVATQVAAAPQVAPAHAIQARAETRPEAKGEPKPATIRPKPPAPPRVVKRPGAVLSDTQIASIKGRLKLTADQQQMWPAVEQALRSLSYAKKPADEIRSVSMRTADIDPDSNEVQRLKSAAFPLLMSFSDDQKRELRILAHVNGLEKLASQF